MKTKHRKKMRKEQTQLVNANIQLQHQYISKTTLKRYFRVYYIEASKHEKLNKPLHLQVKPQSAYCPSSQDTDDQGNVADTSRSPTQVNL